MDCDLWKRHRLSILRAPNRAPDAHDGYRAHRIRYADLPQKVDLLITALSGLVTTLNAP